MGKEAIVFYATLAAVPAINVVIHHTGRIVAKARHRETAMNWGTAFLLSSVAIVLFMIVATCPSVTSMFVQTWGYKTWMDPGETLATPMMLNMLLMFIFVSREEQCRATVALARRR